MVKKGFLLFIILIPNLIFAQNFRIFGVVTNSKNEPLENASVANQQTGYGTLTNLNGKYSIAVTKSNSLKIIFSMIGYKPKEYTLGQLTKNTELNVVLEDDETTLNAVTIDGTKRITSNIERIDYLATKRASNPWGSIESMLVTIGGVSSQNELSSQYSVRGGNFDENIVYVNGIEIYRPLLVRSAQQEGLSFINPNLVQTVNFSAGGYSAEYGDKMSSVLDITYRKPAKFEGAVSASLLGGDIYIGGASNRFSHITGVRYKTTKSLLNSTDTQAEYDPSFIDAQTSITYTLNSKWEAAFLGNYSHNTYRYTPIKQNTNFGTLEAIKSFTVYFNGWENDKFLTYQGALSLNGKINDKINLSITGSTFSSDEQERYDIKGQYYLQEVSLVEGENSGLVNDESLLGMGTYYEHARNKLKSEVYNLSHTGSYKQGRNMLKWKLSYQKEKITDKIKEWEMRDSAGYSLPNTSIDINVFSNLKSDNQINPSRFSGSLHDTYRFVTNQGLFIVNAGIRGSYWTFNKEFILSPRGAIAFVPTNNENLSFRLSGGVYYQAPFYKEFQKIVNVNGNNIIELNENIKSQKSIHVVLGSDYYFGARDGSKPFKFSGEIYYKKLSDIVPYTVNNVKIRYAAENIADGYAMGLDVKLYGEFIPKADSWISFSLMKAEQNINGVKTPFPTDQRYNIALFYQDYFPKYERLKMSMRAVLSQGLPVSVPNRGYDSGYFRTPAYKRVDIGFSWQLLGEDFAVRNQSSFFKSFKNIWLGMDILNLFDMKNVNTYNWISDIYNQQYAVPNYLTNRQFNVKLIAEF